jgi:hypothetical protein
MKRCPACNRTYSDETFTFCLADGSLLSAPFDLEKTLVLQTPPQPYRETEPTQLASNKAPLSRRSSDSLYLEFWKGFTEFCRIQGTFLRLNKQSTRHWYAISLGRAGFAISVTASSQKRRLGCELYLSGENAKRNFKLLERDKRAIEEKTGTLEWEELPSRGASRIVLYRSGIDIANKSTWNDSYTWLKSEAELFYNTFVPLIKELPR